MGNDEVAKERESIEKNNAELKKQSASEEERRTERERMETERRNTERLRREREQKEQAEHLKQVEEHRKQREKELADRQVGGGNSKELESQLARGRQLDMQSNQRGMGAKQEKPYKSLEERQINADYRFAMNNLKKHYCGGFYRLQVTY